jgi:Tol biopolymer transport system component
VKALTYAVLLVSMVAFGFGVYRVAGALKPNEARVVKPSSTTAEALPGTMYLAQQGAIYRFRDGAFSQITDGAGWTEPAVSPDGSQLVAVRRFLNYSDVYLLSSSGRVLRQLTHHSSSQVEANHWAFYPTFSADGSSVFYSYDDKDPYATYRVDLAIFALAADGSGAVVQWTTPNDYTGGDADPVPLHNGGLVYTKYSIDDKSQVHSQVWIVRQPGLAGTALTPPEDNCSEPALSRDGSTLAMVCRHNDLESTDLVVTRLDATAMTIGPETVLVHGQLASSPVFSPDGRSIVFLAPVQTGEAFQLWTVPASGSSASPSAARPLTQNLGLDSSTAPAWAK